jgi:hypothetical protein
VISTRLTACSSSQYAVVRETFKMVTPKAPVAENGVKASAEPKNQ